MTHSRITPSRFIPLVLLAAVSATALTGCAALTDQLQNETSREYDTTAQLVSEWDKTAPWLPTDATDILIRETRDGAPAVLLATSDTALDAELCVETERRSAPTFEVDGGPDGYTDTVFACGDWAVIPTDDGWFGWTPNHPDEKAAVAPEG